MSTDSLKEAVDEVTSRVRNALAAAVAARRADLLEDDTSHYEVYRILGVPPSECELIDLYQNVGRFVYKYAGALLENTTRLLLEDSGKGGPITLPNTVSRNPVNFEIDCYTSRDNKAHEIKWRDATTDGDHIRKEMNKITSIVHAGYIPVRVMYYMPVRTQVKRIQERILDLFREHGEAYVGEEAWEYVSAYAGFDLKAALREFDQPHPEWLATLHELGEDVE